MNRLLALLLLALALPPGWAADWVNALQRKQFLAAEKALQQGNLALFETLAEGLRDYPLYPYLEYARLSRDLQKRKPEEITRFLTRYADTPLAPRLRRRWLDHLARSQRWADYLAFYDPADTNVTRRCHYLNALLHQGKRTQALAQVGKLWHHGRSRPKACDPVFAAWRRAGGLTPEAVWARLELAMNQGQLKLARYLVKQLPKEARATARLWLKLHEQPELALDRLPKAHPMTPAMAEYAARRKARLDPVGAIDFWQALQSRHSLPAARKQRVERTLALRLIREPAPQAWAFLESLQPAPDDLQSHEARLRGALWRGRWERLSQWIEALPQPWRDSERWRYWLARALEQTGRGDQAKALYRALAQERSFYGFLAADRLGLAYNLKQVPAPVERETLERLAKEPGVARARELVALERWPDARREWRLVTAALDREGILAAARLASQWGWHDQAIFTLARAAYWDDLELRFPLVHTELVRDHARQRTLDASWVFGVIRQESAFNPLVRSHAGALGLMQLMPATARYVARKLLGKKRSPRRHELTRPEVNIELGTAYLSDVLERLEDNPVLATAAYNAGPHRVSRWLPDDTLAADVWIELIPFRETRTYVQRVFTYAVIYDHRQGRDIVRLSRRLRPIQGNRAERTAQRPPERRSPRPHSERHRAS